MPSCTHCGHQSAEPFQFCPRCGAQQVGAADPVLGRTLAGKYRVVEEIGVGSMGRVYRGEHVALQKRVALKILHPDLRVTDDALRRFQREGIAAGQIDHPNAIQIFDFERTEDGLVFLAMEYVDGESLKSWITRHGPLEPADAIELTGQLLDTLARAHGHGIVHRDLKPENLMVVEASRGGRSLKVLDFGLSKLLDQRVDASLQTMAGRVLGTPLYMAPEQWRGDAIDARTDLYAVALILYEMVAGQPPFQGRDVTEVMAKTTSEPPPSLAASSLHGVPRDLDELVRKGLAKDPDERFQSAGEMLRALEAVDPSRLARRSARGSAPRRRRTPAAPRHRGPWPWVAAAAAAALLGTGAWWVLGGEPSQAESVSSVRSIAEPARSAEQRAYLTLLDDAWDSLRAGEPQAALRTVERALRMPCADAEGYLIRGHAFRALDDRETARADYEDALERRPGYADARAAMGWLHVDGGDDDAAAAEFDAALEKDADCAEALTGKAAVLLERGAAAAAHTLLDDAVGRGVDPAPVQLWLGRARLALDDPDGAARAFVEAKRRDSSLWQAWEGLGDSHARRGETDAAITQYEEALGLSGGDPDVTRKLAELLLAGGRPADASRVLEPAIATHPGDGRLHLLRALVAQARDERAAAIAALQDALEGGVPDPGRAHLLLAQLLVQEGRHREAMEACAAAAEAGDRPEAYLAWGLALHGVGEHREAVAKLQDAAALAPNDPRVHYSLGVLAMDYLAEPDRALEHFERYRRSGGDDPRVEQWMRELARR